MQKNNKTKIPNTLKKNESSTKRYFGKMLAKGAIVILPTVIVLFLFSFLFKLILKAIQPISVFLSPVISAPFWVINVISILFLLFALIGIGGFVHYKIGHSFFNSIEQNYLKKIPFYKPVRAIVQQFSGSNQMPFKQVVLIDPFGTGCLMTGFVTATISEEILTIFVPSAPNPTNGNIFHVPVEKIKFLEIGSDKAMQTVIGMGAGSKSLFIKA